jgi:hypothetical protein
MKLVPRHPHRDFLFRESRRPHDEPAASFPKSIHHEETLLPSTQIKVGRVRILNARPTDPGTVQFAGIGIRDLEPDPACRLQPEHGPGRGRGLENAPGGQVPLGVNPEAAGGASKTPQEGRYPSA